MAPEPTEVREIIIAGIAVPINEVIGLRFIVEHATTGGRRQFSSVTVNLTIDMDVFAAAEAALQYAASRARTTRVMGSPRGEPMAQGLTAVYVGGFDRPNIQM